jgi:cytochrome c oxidase assembly protein subunit 15
MPTGPVTHGKAWIEMIHRYLATGVGVLIVVLAVRAGWIASRARAAQPRFAVVGQSPGVGLPAGRVRRAHGDDEAVPR